MTRSNHVSNGRVAREARRESAAKRAADREARTAKQQLDRVKRRLKKVGGRSERELTRLKTAS